MSTVVQLSQAVQTGRVDDVLTLIDAGLDEGIPAQQLLDDGLLGGMAELGARFRVNEAWVPEVLVAARALNRGIEQLKPVMLEDGVEFKGRAIIGTVEGDLHDIGKNLVKMVLEGAGFDVIDLGVNVADERFVAAVRQHAPDFLCLSALLTTTIHQLKSVIAAVSEAGLRDQVKILVGGAPVTREFAESIGADGYAADAVSAAELACQLAAVTV